MIHLGFGSSQMQSVMGRNDLKECEGRGKRGERETEPVANEDRETAVI